MQVWFELVRDWGYFGVFALMAMESSIFPVPSEIVVPPAAYWAAQGRMTFFGVWLASTAGSYFGSIVTYAVARALGRPLIERYGKYVFLPPNKVEMAETLLRRYSAGGIFFSRLLPVVRHLISIPAGLIRMEVLPFSVLTLVGAGIWCFVLAWFGQQVIGDRPDLMTNPEALVGALKAKLIWFVVAVGALGGSYLLMKWMARRPATKTDAEAPPAP